MTRKPQSPHQPQGFTLVELLVVVVIVATLAGISAVLARSMITRAHIAESTGNLRQLAIANINYASDHGRFCPADDQQNLVRWHGARTSSSARFDPKRGLLSPYLGRSQRVTQCPLFKPDEGGFDEGSGGYGYNSTYIGGVPGAMYDNHTKLRISQRPANVANPERTVMFATTAYATAAGLREYAFCEPPFWDFGNGPSGHRPSPSTHFRANGKALVAAVDGSVVAVEPNDAHHGHNPHGGDSRDAGLGWFGPEENNGRWNPANP